VSIFIVEGNGKLRRGIKGPEGVMKHQVSKNKKQPTRHQYGLALKTIRAQFQTIESQSDTIRRQSQFMAMIWMDDQTPANRRKSQEDEGWKESPNRWIN
jgi:hypothetical protein